MTPAQRDAIPKALITDVPGCDISIRADLLTTLWTNPNPSETSFSAQNISLSSSDYDLLLCIHSHGSTIVNKGDLIFLNGNVASTTTLGVRRRLLRYSTDILYTADDGYYSTRNSSGQDSFAIDNNACVPMVIYGIKKTIEFDFSSIASDVSTLASNCMMSDGVTSVEDTLGSLIITRQQNLGAQSVTANSNYQWTIAPTAISGYTPIGILGYYTSINNINQTIYLCRIENGNIQFGLRNEGGSTNTFTPIVNIIYIKTIS